MINFMWLYSEIPVVQESWGTQPIPYGLTARIAGFHPAGPGSTPGMGIFFRRRYNFYLCKIQHLMLMCIKHYSTEYLTWFLG